MNASEISQWWKTAVISKIMVPRKGEHSLGEEAREGGRKKEINMGNSVTSVITV